ncbi:MAG: HEAT repeat domain-containing protein [Treponema sp.]|jgi:HEAT repeat protein|nr:HEAT repeat domain-containing protein [Treponema sp.]
MRKLWRLLALPIVLLGLPAGDCRAEDSPEPAAEAGAAAGTMAETETGTETGAAAGTEAGTTAGVEPAPPEKNSAENSRLAVIHYGTETEIAALIQTLKAENADYLDDELIAMVENTRNRSILSGVFSFFGDRGKGGLEDRAIRAIEERDEEVNETVLSAVEYLGRVKAGAAVGPLMELIDHDEQRFFNGAIRALGRIGGTDREEADRIAIYLMDFYTESDPASENRRETVSALGAAGSVKAVAFLSEIADSGDERVPLRIAALEALSKIGDEGGLKSILAAVTAQDPNIRSAAVEALGPFSGPEADRAILEAFRDSYYRTRIAAARAARERKLKEAVPYLKFRAERDEVPAVKDEAIRALGAIAAEDSASQEAETILKELFGERKNSDRVRIGAAEMLMKYDPGRYLDALTVELDEAKRKNQTPLYNGFLKVAGEAKTEKLIDTARRFLRSGGIIEKSYALDMAVNNGLRGLSEEIKALTEDKNASLAGKARRTLEKLEE